MMLIKFLLGKKLYRVIKNKIYIFLWYFTKDKLPNLPDNKKNIHLGCGTINHPDFINVDLRWYKHIHYHKDISDLKVFKENFADLIYVCHCLEHISHTKINDTLKEWFRVLKPGGILRISVPDFDKILFIYQNTSNNLDAILHPLLGAQNFKYNFHYSAFNKKNLSQYLLKAGFRKVKEWKYGTKSYTSFPDWSGRTINIQGIDYPISLNLEGYK